MQKVNEYGNYERDTIEEVGRVGDASAQVIICQCEEDGLFRYRTAMGYAMGGYGGPISASTPGYPTDTAARTAAIDELVRRLPVSDASFSDEGRVELARMTEQLKAAPALSCARKTKSRP